MSSDRTNVLGGQSLYRSVKENVGECGLCEFTGGWGRFCSLLQTHTGRKDKETEAERLIDFSRIPRCASLASALQLH